MKTLRYLSTVLILGVLLQSVAAAHPSTGGQENLEHGGWVRASLMAGQGGNGGGGSGGGGNGGGHGGNGAGGGGGVGQPDTGIHDQDQIRDRDRLQDPTQCQDCDPDQLRDQDRLRDQDQRQVDGPTQGRSRLRELRLHNLDL